MRPPYPAAIVIGPAQPLPSLPVGRNLPDILVDGNDSLFVLPADVVVRDTLGRGDEAIGVDRYPRLEAGDPVDRRGRGVTAAEEV